MARLARGFLPRNKNYSLERVIKLPLDQVWNFFKHTILFSHMIAPSILTRALNSKDLIMVFFFWIGLSPSVITCRLKVDIFKQFMCS